MDKVIIKKLPKGELEKRGVFGWPVWEKKISRFPWSYSGDEEFLIIEGEVVIETDKKNYTLKAGDFVTLKKGLDCYWDIKSDIKKYYNFP